ncbi:twin-arginine translocase TatA/TatE family subunit [Cellulomonas sp. 179-A 4D5 NHS]|uniref:twin-arginine translocase TatA/TatE family subunit n=1 Tax=Cellulomonas sp. 179-A 4D5 NHS TaxID=3142378 RepID=UPI0039A1B0C1
MFDINGGELIVLLIVAVLVIGPERLPAYAEQLGRWARRARVFLRDTKERVDEELGDEVRDVDWAALDPRRYDPRRIVREALLDDVTPVRGERPGAVAGSAAAYAARNGSTTRGPRPAADLRAGEPAPFDDEAT